MFVFSSKSFEQHEFVSFTEDAASGLRAIIAVHNSNLGPAVGGCRMFPYASDDAALNDVLRLSRGMTYKSALAGLPMGGGKAVIIGDSKTQKTPALLEAMGRFVEAQNGRYVTAEDSGTCVEDMRIMAEYTEHVSGLNSSQEYGGDPSPLTAFGVYCGIQSALKFRTGSGQMSGVKVAVQGAGAVGYYLIELLTQAGAEVSVSDVNIGNLERAEELGAQRVNVENIITQEVDVFAPCAMGAVLNNDTIPTLRAGIVAGGANNQLANTEHGEMLRRAGKLYAPDFVINAGGIIEIHHQNSGSMDQSRTHIRKIGDTLESIFNLSEEQQISTVTVAEALAEEKFMHPPAGSTVSNAA